MKYLNNKKGVSLIIVIFAILLFSGLAWTLMSMQSGEFESNMRNFESEKALYLAESGAQWGVSQYSLNTAWRTTSAAACSQVSDWVLHTMGAGQYRVCCRNPNAAEPGEAVIEAEGYAPSYVSYLAKRKVKLSMITGGLSRAAQVRYLFDWSGSFFNLPLIFGDIGVTDRPADSGDGYEGSGNAVHNESSDVNTSPLRPPGSGKRELFSDDSGFPVINMVKIETQYAGNIYTPPRGAELTDIQAAGGKSTLTFDAAGDIFNVTQQSQFVGQALRNTTMGSWQSGSWGVIEEVLSVNSCRLTGTVIWEDKDANPDARGDRVCLVPKISTIAIAGSGGNWNSNPRRTYQITFDCQVPFTVGNVLRNFSSEARNSRVKEWDYRDWGEITGVSSTVSPPVTTISVELDSLAGTAPGWQVDDWVGEAKEFSGSNSNAVWFIRGDMLYNLRGGGANCNQSSFTAEGDIGLMGSGGITIKAHVKNSANPTLPNLASENGSIYSDSFYLPLTRVFQGIVYTYNGNVTFDSINGTSVFGYNVTFSGFVNLNYNCPINLFKWDKYVSGEGFYGGQSSFSWSEEE
ncbi:MAG: hypothetical protein WC335_05875 [Candidatus Omnitrophota bacterium]|jgi:hypothetical protein